jgi:hypothetical protein
MKMMDDSELKGSVLAEILKAAKSKMVNPKGKPAAMAVEVETVEAPEGEETPEEHECPSCGHKY